MSSVIDYLKPAISSNSTTPKVAEISFKVKQIRNKKPHLSQIFHVIWGPTAEHHVCIRLITCSEMNTIIN